MFSLSFFEGIFLGKKKKIRGIFLGVVFLGFELIKDG